LGLRVEDELRRLMRRHFELLIEANRRFNLTRITAAGEAALKHYADSLSLLATRWLDAARPLEVLDVGTGAGFPAVPLAVVCPAWRITAIDGTGKKARFLADAAKALGLTNLRALHARSADLARRPAMRFDAVLMRAVARLGPGIEEAHGLVRRGGSLIFYKTAGISNDEWAEGAGAAERRGLRPFESFEVTLAGCGQRLERRLLRCVRG
ncbi:MAG: 16S rRNA (guanine(527)-N(7))-methyltransferase RsmG, partial [Phycisphaerae bacterium]